MIYDFEGQTPKIDPGSWVAPNAVIIGRVELKKNSNIWFNTTLRGDLEPIIIGENSNIQDGSVIHTDPGCPTIVGNGVTVGHMVMLHGCEIADDCLIGIGSTILNKTKIGKNCIIGANALVTENKVIENRDKFVEDAQNFLKTSCEESEILDKNGTTCTYNELDSFKKIVNDLSTLVIIQEFSYTESLASDYVDYTQTCLTYFLMN